jgi:hypothetical protein
MQASARQSVSDVSKEDGTKRTPRGKIAYRIDKQTTLEVIQDYESGLSGDQVAATYEVSRWVVANLVRANGSSMRYKRLTTEERKLIGDFHAQGISQVDIAARIHRRPPLVWHSLHGQLKNLTGEQR